MADQTHRAREVWAQTTLRVWPEAYSLVSLPPAALAEAARLVAAGGGAFLALVVTREEVSLTVPAEVWARHPLAGQARATSGPHRVLTFDAEVEPDLCGYLAPVAARLAEAGVPIVPQCAFARDHVLVPSAALEEATRVIQDWIRSCQA